MAVDDGVLQDWSDRGLNDSFAGAVAVYPIFEVPAVALLVILHARVVVALIEILEDRREDFRFLIRKIDPLVGRLEELSAARSLKPWRVGKYIFVRGEESLLAANSDCDDCTATLISTE